MNASDLMGYGSFTIGVLSVLVTVLIGWQIFVLIDTRKLAKRITEMKVELRNEIHTHIEALQATMSMEALDIATVAAHAAGADMENGVCLLLRDFREFDGAGKEYAFVYAFRYLEALMKIASPDRIEALGRELSDLDFPVTVWDDFYHRMTVFCEDNPSNVDPHSIVRLQQLILQLMQQALAHQLLNNENLS
ncbi:MAG: hypothetical protein K2K08_08620 [Paramuribaculum sp.]|nr:hypothetical protein [Paramuribaculum sp.]